jgi:excisionase family DNA binding protein
VSARLDAALAELAAALREEMRAELAEQGNRPTRLLSVDEAATMLGIGRTALYDQLAAGRIRSVKVGRRRLVPATAVAELADEAGDLSPPGAAS